MAPTPTPRPVSEPGTLRPRKGALADSLRYAVEGLGYVVRHERNARIHLAMAIAVVALGLWLGLSLEQWAFMVAAIALVFAGEMLNTVVELLVDLICPDVNPLAKHVKDVAAGAILVASLAAALLGVMILGPKLWLKLAAWLAV
ncbi:MAG: diacylglycerol kinase family protein [Chloroflexota bacterium]